MRAAVRGGTVTDIALQDALGWMAWGVPALDGRPVQQIAEISAMLMASGPPGQTVRPTVASSLGWRNWIDGGIGAFAYRALLATTPQADRASLLALLDTWKDTPFAASPGCFRYVWVADEPGFVRQSVTFTEGDGRFYVGRFSNDPYPAGRRLTQYSPDRSFNGALPWKVIRVGEPFAPRWGRPAQISACIDAITGRGPVAWRLGDVESMAHRLGISTTGAAVLMAGLPALHDDRSDLATVDATTRDLTGLSAPALANALDEVGSPSDTMDNLRLFDQMLPADITELWSTAGYRAAMERLASGWTAIRSKSIEKLSERGAAVEDNDVSLTGTTAAARSVITITFDPPAGADERSTVRALVDNWVADALGRIFDDGSIAYIGEMSWDLDETTDLAGSGSVVLDLGSAPASRIEGVVQSLIVHLHAGIDGICRVDIRNQPPSTPRSGGTRRGGGGPV